MWRVDLNDTALLPSSWVERIRDVCANHAQPAVLSGSGPTSLEGEETRLPYHLVTGDMVAILIPWLDCLYRNEFKHIAAQVAGCPVYCSKTLINTININILNRNGQRYERHVDSNPLTGLLFVTTTAEDGGGALKFEFPDRVIRIAPIAGTVLYFSATDVPHAVEPLSATEPRISIPMNYYFEEDSQDRPSGLDYILYGPRQNGKR